MKTVTSRPGGQPPLIGIDDVVRVGRELGVRRLSINAVAARHRVSTTALYSALSLAARQQSNPSATGGDRASGFAVERNAGADHGSPIIDVVAELTVAGEER